MTIRKNKNILEIKENTIILGLFFIISGLLTGFFSCQSSHFSEALDRGMLDLIMLLILPVSFPVAGLLVMHTKKITFKSKAGTVTINKKSMFGSDVELHKFEDVQYFSIGRRQGDAESKTTYFLYVKIKHEKIPFLSCSSRYNGKKRIMDELNDWLSCNKDNFNRAEAEAEAEDKAPLSLWKEIKSIFKVRF